MILQEEFKQNGYKDLLVGENALDCDIDLENLFDLNQRPEELLGIYISSQKDELFFLLDGDKMDINSLCDCWDDRIRVFMIINGKSNAIQKLKYNIVQLIIYSKDVLDKSKEGNLLISRKIIIRGDIRDRNQILIDDSEVIELPFHMIPADAFAPDEEKIRELHHLLPNDDSLMKFLIKKHRKVNRSNRNGILDKSFDIQDFNRTKEWLET